MFVSYYVFYGYAVLQSLFIRVCIVLHPHPTVNCTQLYLGDTVNRSENWGSHSHPTNDSRFLRRWVVSTGM